MMFKHRMHGRGRDPMGGGTMFKHMIKAVEPAEMTEQ
jgi:hypothetical protein